MAPEQLSIDLGEGQRLRDEILQAMRVNDPELAERIRKYGHYLCHRNIGYAVYGIPHVFTADDLRERLPLEVLAGIKDKRFFGAVLGRKEKFVPVGWKITRAPGSHGRQIRLFTTPDYLAVVRKFQSENPELFR